MHGPQGYPKAQSEDLGRAARLPRARAYARTRAPERVRVVSGGAPGEGNDQPGAPGAGAAEGSAPGAGGWQVGSVEARREGLQQPALGGTHQAAAA